MIIKMTAEDFFKNHNVTRVEDLSHSQLVEFAQTCMDDLTKSSIHFFLAGLDFEIKPLFGELDRAIIKAYNEGMSVITPYNIAERCIDDFECGAPGYEIQVIPKIF